MPLSKKEKTHSEQEAYIKISAWCAFQERSHLEVRNKLYEYGVKTDQIEEIIFRLISENFLNEERFARLYAGGKFRLKKWGRLKIKQGLKTKEVSENCIKIAMQEISAEDYFSTLKALKEKKAAELKAEQNQFVKNKKIAAYLIGKGFESDLVWEIIKDSELK